MADEIREPEKLRRGDLSVQASKFHYCEPRVDGLPFTDYQSYEVAMWNADGAMCRPSETLGKLHRKLRFLPRVKEARALDPLFEDSGSPVAGWVKPRDVKRLRKLLS